MPLSDVLFGKPLKSDEQQQEKIGPLAGIPIFGLDALGSAAYGPEAALTVLMPLGAAGLFHVIPITATIIVLLAILYFSYRQTIDAYPSGGGSYTVASENLGQFAGLFAGAALMIDYVLVAAVGISAGTGALISAVPSLQPYTLPICLAMLALITIVNLRGLRDTGVIFLLPTYLFIVCLLTAIGLGVFASFASGGHPHPISPPHPLGHAVAAGGLWLLLRVFSNGCTAMTGVEAVSNGITAFREPRTKSAKMTLTIIVGILALMLAGISYLSKVYAIGATEPGRQGYESVLSQLTGAVAGKGIFYYVTITSILLVLTLQANTAFAGFPRVCSVIAEAGFLPRAFANRGRRLVYSHGIYVLVTLTAILLIIFGGVTDRLIPLFAIGAFLAFTFSQSGMVMHWRRAGGKGSRRNMLVNGLGAIATGIALCVVLVSKFVEGAWITLALLPAILLTMRAVRSHYDREDQEVSFRDKCCFDDLRPPVVMVPMDQWNKITHNALRFALTLSPDVFALHVTSSEKKSLLPEQWAETVERPARERNSSVPQLVVLDSPYRFILTPILNYAFDLERRYPDRSIAVVVPNLVERRWYQRFLHNQRGELLSALLLLNGKGNIVIVNVPWYLRS